ncbi:MAG TPA: hypothetical protein VK165_20205 [Azonexus sp.]|nr:hypothetical protein [Azonexus sp.]
MAIHSPAMDTSPRIYDAVMAVLDSKRIPQRTVADESGVPFSTVCKIAQRNVKDPSVHTVQRLYDYFADRPLVAPLLNVMSIASSAADCSGVNPVFASEENTPFDKEAA